MAEPTLQQVFGAGATQTATTITILKTDLATVGLTANATNSAESLFVALLLLAAVHLNTTNLDSNIDQSVSIEDSFDAITTRNNVTYRQKTKSINFYKIDSGTSIDPDDY